MKTTFGDKIKTAIGLSSRSTPPPALPEITPLDCWQKLQAEPDSFLIDVRTTSEWLYVGVPDLASIGKELICVEWLPYAPIQEPNEKFAATLAHYVGQALPENKTPQEAVLYFMCRSGKRSMAAALEMSAQGFAHCFNVLEGFEGDLDEHQHRGLINGWKVSNLPWVQG